MGTRASRLANRENILPSSAFVTHLDNMDLITMEEKAKKNPVSEPMNNTRPFQAMLVMSTWNHARACRAVASASFEGSLKKILKGLEH